MVGVGDTLLTLSAINIAKGWGLIGGIVCVFLWPTWTDIFSYIIILSQSRLIDKVSIFLGVYIFTLPGFILLSESSIDLE